ncbi:hypothetical protein OOK31_16540 [Streptomyces sp. NBC_00249]|uniref:hypothetical protein n=1 Tax=Streptomyces sp. NBC_00249 TaxID=2975690 RepID=UPI002252C191|nr:hypothetical protein [Streptomyces sp. NBC_00249]MCX5195493.1 hypothetical protein [Streptomyces sp. NBC_00249]
MPSLNVTFAEHELALLRLAAASAGQSLARFVRGAALAEAWEHHLRAAYEDMHRNLSEQGAPLADRATYLAVVAQEGTL